MNNIIELAKSETLGMVYKGPCGHINVCVQGITLHFTESVFMSYARMIAQAKNRIVEHGLASIFEADTETE